MKKEMIVQCCVCGAMKDKNGKYDGIERPIIRTGKVSHGYCPKDYAHLLNQIDELEGETSC